MEIAQFRPGQKLCLTDLSNEVLALIAECISKQMPRISIFQFSRCSRRLHEVSQPFFHWEFEEDNGWQHPADPFRTLPAFLCRILARPDLARGIKKYKGVASTFRDHTDGDIEMGLDTGAITLEDFLRIRAAIKNLEPDGVKTALWDAERGSWEAMMTLVLSLLPNLEELNLTDWPPYADRLPSLTSFLSRAADCQKGIPSLVAPPPSYLTHLTRVDLSYRDTEGGMKITDVKPFMKLKSVQSISAYMVTGNDGYYDESQAWEPEDSAQNSETTNVVDISFTNSALTYREMTQFLQECPNLQRFQYEHGGGTVGFAAFLPPRFMVALRQVKSTLEDLVMENMDGLFGATILEIYPFGSFADFPNLKSIDAQLRMLVGGAEHSGLRTPTNDRDTEYPYPRSISLIAALPSSIESLKLRSCRPEETSTLLELLDHIDSFPRLKHLDIKWRDVPYSSDYSKPFIHPGFSAAERVKFESQCSAAGVELKTSGGRFPSRILHHWCDDTGELMGGQQGAYMQRRVEYPYEGWEKLCEKFECDPATGFRFDTVRGPGPRLPSSVRDRLPLI